MKKAVWIVILVLLVQTIAFAGGGKVQERNPEINGDVDPPVERRLGVHGEV